MGILLGNHLCNSGLLHWNQRSLKDYQKTVEVLNRAGRKLKASGIHLHYHNHEFEFDTIADCPDKTGMDVLWDELHFSFVVLFVDVAWVSISGMDPESWLRQNRGQCAYLHFKDYVDLGWTELGKGKVNFDPLIKYLKESPEIAYVMVEQDDSRINPLESVKISREFLKTAYGY